MPLTAIALDEGLLATGSEARRAEWRLAIQELLEDHMLKLPDEKVTLHLVHNRIGTRLLWLDDAGVAVAAPVIVPADALDEHLRDYVSICTSMASSAGGSASVEALDMAKKLAHDRAGRMLASHLSSFAPTLSTCRRLFTLLLTIHVDTTTLGAYHLGHATRLGAILPHLVGA